MAKKVMQPIACWDCANLGNCQHYGQKCEKFEKFTYKTRDWDMKKIAKEMDISTGTLRYWLEHEEEQTVLKRIERQLGIGFKIIKSGATRTYRQFAVVRVNGKEL